MKDAVATMGGLLPDDAGGRDAVHVAVFSAFSRHRLKPGQEVCLIEKGERDSVVGPANSDFAQMIAIVDPFLRDPIQPGDRFWAYLRPRTITSLSHRWAHPAFEPLEETVYATPSAKIESENWLRDFCAKADCPGYYAVMAAAEIVASGYGQQNDFNDNCLHFRDDAHGEIPPEFWDHVSVVLGRPIRGKRAQYFSCSC